MHTCPCNEDPLTPHLYIVKLGCRVHTFYLIFAIKIDCGYSLEPPQCINNLCSEQYENKKIIIFFHLKINIFTAVKYCCILHGRVCVMYAEFSFLSH